MSYKEKYLLVEQFLANSMSEKEKSDFLNELKNDSTMKEMVTIHNELVDLIPDRSKLQVHERLQKISNEYKENSARKKRKYWWYAAASIVLMILIGTYSFVEFYSTDIYASFYQPYKVSSQLRAKSSEDIALEYYEKEQYVEAISALKNVIPEDRVVGHLRLYLGIALMEVGEFKLAQKELNRVSRSNCYHKGIAGWYESLCWIKLGEKEEAIEVLRLQEVTDSEFGIQAVQLVKELEE